MDYIETPKKQIPIKQIQGTTIVKTKVQVTKPSALDTYKSVKENHKHEIKALKNDIKRHKLLLKQAKNVYKLSKLAA